MNGNAADFQQPIHLAGGKVIGGFVGGNAVFVQTARFGARLEYLHLMAQHRQAVRARQPRRPRPHNRHFAPRGRRAGEGVNALVHQRIGGIALQRADFDRLALGHLAHAGPLAQNFCGANPRAHTAHDVLRQNCFGRRIRRASGNLANEQRNIYIGGAGRDAGRVMAKVTPISGNPRAVIIQLWGDIGKVAAQFIGI